jgi:hypothetical protein
MEKGQYGYMNRYKRNVLISIIILGLFIIVGVFMTVFMFNTKKSVFILIPILIAIPFAKQIIAYLLCAGFREIGKEEHKKILDNISYSDDASLMYDVSISRYEGIIYFPVAVVRDGRILVYYNKKYDKKIPNGDALKKEILKTLDMKKNPYVVVVTTDLDSFIDKANHIKAPGEDFKVRDGKIRERLCELGI